MNGKITTQEFIAALETYGADVDQWPGEAAAAARAALAVDAECQAHLAEAREWANALRRPRPAIGDARAERLTVAVLAVLPARAPSVEAAGWDERLGGFLAGWKLELEIALATVVVASVALNLLPSLSEPSSVLDHLTQTWLERL